MSISACRICGHTDLEPILSLGDQALTGVFPGEPDAVVPTVPLDLIRCTPPGCGLVQLRHTADFGLMFNDGYGYRSGIRPFMIDHLGSLVASVRSTVDVGPSDLVIDIGSNDSTLLRSYLPDAPTMVGFDLVGEKFRHLYPPGADLVAGPFSADSFRERYGERRARIVTSVAMFYDLPDPLAFVRDVRDVLAPDGLWVAEQSYLASMLEVGAYDVVCHEHLEYYALAQFEWMAERSDLVVVDAEVTDVYGGSLRVTLGHRSGPHPPNTAALDRIRAAERAAGLTSPAPYEAFARQSEQHRDRLVDFLDRSRAQGRTTLGYGASTKGNVILQYCGLTEAELPCIGEVSPEKAGRFTPGNAIPIVSEEDAKARRPDQLLVLPWIYRDGFVEREAQFLRDGGSLLFPLPSFEVVS